METTTQPFTNGTTRVTPRRVLAAPQASRRVISGPVPYRTDFETRVTLMIRQAQNTICSAVEALDEKPFHEDAWTFNQGIGGGISRVIQDGTVFEKAGIDATAIRGPFTDEMLQAAMGSSNAAAHGIAKMAQTIKKLFFKTFRADPGQFIF